jgi:TrmH family RNA methyltransferase
VGGPVLTSSRSPRVTAARRLAKRAFRSRERLFLAEGPQAVREAVASPGTVLEVFATTEAAARHPEIIDAARVGGATVTPATDGVIAAMAQTITPQGMVAICRFVDVRLDEAVDGDARLVVVLAQVRDPGNAGTVIRAADAAGADAVVVTDSSVDVYNPKCVRASAGSLFHLPVVVDADFDAAVAAGRAAGLAVVAADGAAPVDLDDAVDDGRLSASTMWVFGNEAWGLPDEVLTRCDGSIRVPIHGRAESLNLATAAAVCLYASARAQRR